MIGREEKRGRKEEENRTEEEIGKRKGMRRR